MPDFRWDFTRKVARGEIKGGDLGIVVGTFDARPRTPNRGWVIRNRGVGEK